MATIKLTNPVNGKTHTMQALVDTGSARMALPQDVVDFLALKTIDTVQAERATGETRPISVAGPFTVDVLGRTMRPGTTSTHAIPRARIRP